MDNKFDIDAGLKSGQDLMGKDGVLPPLIKQLTEGRSFGAQCICPRFASFVTT
jgi:hypothetical protein